MNFCWFLEIRPGLVVRTDIVEMENYSLSETEYFVAFIDEASGLKRERHMKRKVETADFQYEHVSWTDRETDSSVKKIVANEWKE